MLYGVGTLNFDEAVEAEGCPGMGNATSEGSRRNRREHDLGASNFAARRETSYPKEFQMMEAVVERENMFAALR